MRFWLILTPLVSAFIGWGIASLAIKLLFHPRLPVKVMGSSIQGIIPKRLRALSLSKGNLLSPELISFPEIEQKILDPTNLQKIMPEIESHIDHFLRVKLKDAIPMVAMFVGDKTIIQLKEVFMTEMKTLFPVIMKSYVNELKNDLNAEEVIKKKIASLPPEKIEFFILKIMRKEFQSIKALGAGIGFVTGSLQVMITLFI